MQGLLDWFANLPAQVQSGWIAGLTAMITTVLTVGITQYFASRNLKKTLAENRATAQEAQRENKEALNRTLKANENNLNRTLASNKNTLERTLGADAEKHRAELAERRVDRLFNARLEVASECLRAIQEVRGHHNRDKQVKASLQLGQILKQNAGQILTLFSQEISQLAEEIRVKTDILRGLNYVHGVNIKEAKKLMSAPPTDEEEGKLQDIREDYHLKVFNAIQTLEAKFTLFTDGIRKALGTHDETEEE